MLAALGGLDQEKLYRNREVFLKAIKGAFASAKLTVKPALFKAIWQALSEHDSLADICCKKNKEPEADAALRDYENIPLSEDIEEYFQREVLPHLPAAWIDPSKTTVGYEIPFNRHFYTYTPPRSLADIDADLEAVSAEIMELLQEVRV